MDVEDCMKRGLLRTIPKQPDLARKDIGLAIFFLDEARDLLELDKKVMAALGLYNAYFHTARALLFNDGIKERSHYCIARYIEKHHIPQIDISFLDAFETMMSIRHNAQYSTEEIDIAENLTHLAKICEEFISAVERYIQ